MLLILTIVFGSLTLFQCDTASPSQSAKGNANDSKSRIEASLDKTLESNEQKAVDEVITKADSGAEEQETIKEKQAANIRGDKTEVIKDGESLKTQNEEIVKLPEQTSSLEDKEVIEPELVLERSEPATVKSKEIANKSKEATQVEKASAETAQTGFNHSIWDGLLKSNVSNDGSVNYSGIKTDINKLNEYLTLLSENTPETSWSKNKTKAYWINAYNAFTIKLILDNYPLGSITDLHNGKPWDVKWIELSDKAYSLNDIEHVILRPTYKDARIHFAVNCAAKSCPKVWNKAWTEENIEAALDKLTKEFIANTAANQISKDKVSISKIFDWYKEDFGDLVQFLNKYSSTQIAPDATVSFNDYNWKLNS